VRFITFYTVASGAGWVMPRKYDAIAKPMPQGNPSPSLAELWSAGEDGLSYEFVLRKDAKFHNGDPVTADEVKFSFERYRGAAHGLLKERVICRAPSSAVSKEIARMAASWPAKCAASASRAARKGP
jgi:ABC-type transport system substrate-binding protein